MASEKPDIKRPLDTPETIARVTSYLEGWLAEEIRTSSVDHNKVLDDYDDFRKHFDTNSPDGSVRAKNASHHNRLARWTEQFKGLPNSDYALARQLFCIQMYISGAFRNQCYMRASNKDEYLRLRQQTGPSGIDIGAVVEKRMSDPLPSLEELAEKTLETNDAMAECVEYMYSRGVQDVGLQESPSTYVFGEMQAAWTELLVDYLAVGAEQRNGDLSRVPALWPESISNHPAAPAVLYPFTEAS